MMTKEEALALLTKYKKLDPFETDRYIFNFLGASHKKEWEQSLGRRKLMTQGRHEDNVWPPAASEDLIEYLDLLSAIDKAKGRFVMVDLGAGYGRWCVNAAYACMGKLSVVAVEPHPIRYQWLLENLSCIENRAMYCGAISENSRFDIESNPASSYGQTTNEGDGKVDLIDLRKILPNRVDYMTVDIQGDEVFLLQEYNKVLLEKVQLIHLEVHGTWKALENSFEPWNVLYRGAGNQAETPFGTASFEGGIITLENPNVLPIV